jgi:hypothetical protein
MDIKSIRVITAEKKYRDILYSAYNIVNSQKNLCENTPECSSKLQKHLEICENGCSDGFISNDCANLKNVRCSHYYSVQKVKFDIDKYHEKYKIRIEQYNIAKNEYESGLYH